MTVAALVVWLAVVALAVYAVYFARRGARPSPERLRRLIVGGGVAFPAIALAALLTYGLAILPRLLEQAPAGSLRIQVSAEQWWWRVRYTTPGGDPVDLANEIRLPVGETVTFEISSPDVIHSFWIPSFGGKIDAIPGRRTYLTLRPVKTGVFRGVCAEYCGSSHALMAFSVVVLPRDEFDRWLAAQARPAEPTRRALESRGRGVFFASGCGACHAIRGTEARGVVGPDLTHVGSRETLGAGLLQNDRLAFEEWLAHTDTIKPSVQMPAFAALEEEERMALGAFLESLQ